MKYVEFVIRLAAFAVTLFLLLEFIVGCDIKTWKAGLSFSVVSVAVLAIFFFTGQHIMKRCKCCNQKMDFVSSLTK